MEFIWTLVLCAGLTVEGGCAEKEVSAMPSLHDCMLAAQAAKVTRATNMQTYVVCELRNADVIDNHPRSWRIVEADETRI
ncbi:hypothetical protein AAD018_011395 [Aestuariibius insulae]|uniref:hypothetical protein n=1 Tax=Aestuariibius insulae TaxID=2058287 RepID=UPI00345E38AF